ncbi:lipopolysaccharide biosynthesis protein [Allorhizocola rhizosphaerae]|uniref:lipopolysaccharide biosynthesis protein n=1 Tax=Allorhizocola rhizosphaerae TaxID=1872709 RepID=UPI0013C3196E|nr:polysaccharide biosynthesis C-terminal domain-containing protein [Allorhizocola rhizosphaerae]
MTRHRAPRRASLALSSGLLGVSTLISRVSTLALVVLLTRGAGVDAVGYYGLATLSASLVAIGLSFGMPTYLTRQVPAGLVQPSHVTRIHALRFAVLGTVAAVAYPVMAAVAPTDVSLGFFLFFAASMLDQWNETAWVRVRGTASAWKESVVNGCSSILLASVCAADLWLFDGLTFLDAARYCVMVAMLRSLAATVWSAAGRREPGGVPERLHLAKHLRQGFPYLVSDLLGLLYFRGDVLILSSFVAATQVGQYVSATGLINPAVQVASAMSVGALAYAAPRVFTGGEGGSEPTTIYRFFLQAGLAAAGVICVGLPLGVSILFGAEGGPILQLALILSLFLTARFANFGLSAILLAGGGASKRVLVLLASIAASVALNLVLVGRFGAMGSAWSAVVTEFVVAGALLWASRVRQLATPVALTMTGVVLAGGVMVASVSLFGLQTACLVVGACYLIWGIALLARQRRTARVLTYTGEAA